MYVKRSQQAIMKVQQPLDVNCTRHCIDCVKLQEHETPDSRTGMGFQPSAADPGLHFLERDNRHIFMLVYVDEILILARSREDGDWPGVTRVEAQLTFKLEAHDLGQADYFLGIDIMRDRDARTVKLRQRRLTAQLAKTYGLGDCNTKSVPVLMSTFEKLT